jgi:hypothetical protein
VNAQEVWNRRRIPSVEPALGRYNVLLNPAFPAHEGTNPHGKKDAIGKAFHDEFLKVVQTGRVDYVFPRTGQTQLSQKWSYVKEVTMDGAPGIALDAGFWTMNSGPRIQVRRFTTG